MVEETRPKALRGFALLDPARQRELARRGGAAVEAANRSFSRNKELAREAGRKGGLHGRPESRYWAVNPEIAKEMGRKGGLARKKNKT
jgi:uncharacterized protein